MLKYFILNEMKVIRSINVQINYISLHIKHTMYNYFIFFYIYPIELKREVNLTLRGIELKV